MVEVDQVQGAGAVAAPGARHLAADAVAQQHPVRQVGQGVVMGEVEKMVLRAPAVGDVECGGEHMQRRPAGIAQRRLGGEEVAPDAAGIDDRFLEGRQRLAGGEHHLVQGTAALGIVAPEDLGGVAPDDVDRVEAAQLRLVFVDEDAAAVAVGGADHRGNGVDHLRQMLAAVAQRRLAGAFAVDQLAFEDVGAALEQLLLLAQLQEVARAGQELGMVHRALEEIGRSGLQRPQAEAAVLIDRHDHDGHLGAARTVPEAPDEFGAVEARHLVVGNHEIGDRLVDPRQRLDGIAERANGHARLDRCREPGIDVPVGDPVVQDRDQRHAAD